MDKRIQYILRMIINDQLKYWFLNIAILLGILSAGITAESKPAPIEIEGEIERVSQLPDPKKADYPDCYYTALFKVNNIITPGQKLDSEIILVIPGFYNRVLVKENLFAPGQLLHARILLFDNIPEKMRQIQQADQINSLNYEYYFYSSGLKINKLSRIVQSPGGQSTTLHDLAKPVIPAGGTLSSHDLLAKQDRKNTIQKDLSRLNTLLAENGGDWKKWFDKLAPLRKQYKDDKANNINLWVGNSYFKASDFDNLWGYDYNFKDAIIHLNDYLKQRNIDLILVRVPLRGEIDSDLFVPEAKEGILNPYLLKLEKELLDADVEIVDTTPAGIKNRLKFPLMYWYQDEDRHPAEGMAWTIAEVLGERLKRYNFPSIKENYLYLKKVTRSGRAYLWPKGNLRFNPKEKVPFNGVYVSTTHEPLPLSEENNSPILVMGDSFITAPDNVYGGSIPQYLAYKTKVVPNWLARWDGSPGMARFLLLKGTQFLAGRKVCIFCLRPETIHEPITDISDLIQTGKRVLIRRIFGHELMKLAYSPPLNTTRVFRTEVDNIKVLMMNAPTETTVGSVFLNLPPDAGKYKKIMISFVFHQIASFALQVHYGNQAKTLYFHPDESAKSGSCIFNITPNLSNVKIDFVERATKSPVVLEWIEIRGIE